MLKAYREGVDKFITLYINNVLVLNAVHEDSPSLAGLTSDYLSSEGEQCNLLSLCTDKHINFAFHSQCLI